MATAAGVDRDQQWLIDCLAATLNNSQDVRSFAEAALQQASFQSGFGLALAKVAANREVAFGLRQLAAVLLKQFIKQHWTEDDDAFVHPPVSLEEKVSIRQLLLSSLDDPHGKIRTAVGMAVASVATYDWPEEWPELLPFLLKLITDQSNINGVHGALRSLALISTDLDDNVVPTLVPALFPHLHAIVSASNLFEKSTRAKAMSIVHSCTSVLGSMTGVYKEETRALMIPMFKSWIEQFSIILLSPMQCEDPDDWSLRLEVLKCLIQFIQNFPGLVEVEFAAFGNALWHTFMSCLKVYQISQVSQDCSSVRFDSDGTEKSLDTLAIQLFELFLTIVGNHKFAHLLRSNLSELIYHTVTFMQTTEDQVHRWLADANEFVADEDDFSYSCRVSGSMLLEEIVNVYQGEGIDSLLGCVEKHFGESCLARNSGQTDWWKVREASLFAFCSISEHLVEAQDLGLTETRAVDLLHRVLTEDIGRAHEYPLMHARVFVVVAKFSSVVQKNLREQLLYGAAQAIGSDVPDTVKVGACRALSQLLSESDPGFLQSNFLNLFSALSVLLKQASEGTLHLVLETLQATVKAGCELLASVEYAVSPVILDVWVQNVSDPFVSIDALEVMEAIKNSPGCILPLASRVLPSVGSVLQRPTKQPDGLVAGSLDLLTMILKEAPSDIIKAAFDGCFNSVVGIILHSDDHTELQNATECLAAFVRWGKQSLLTWTADPGLVMKCLLDAASRLLEPDLESSGSLFAGTYILQLIFHFPSEIFLHLRELIAALIRRMQSSEVAMLKSSIIVILAKLVHLSVPNIDQFINMLISLPANGCDNSLDYLMSEWTKQQGEIQGSYQIKVTTTALALLLSTRHAELEKINVQGHIIKTNAGIVTRAKAKLAPEQWTTVSLPAKIFALLADTLIEIQENVADDDEDSDWEEVDENTDNQNVILSSGLTSNGKPSMEHLTAMAKVFNESDDDNDFGIDFVKGIDPLNEIKLANYLVEFFNNFLKLDSTLFDRLFQGLNKAQKDAIQLVIRK